MRAPTTIPEVLNALLMLSEGKVRNPDSSGGGKPSSRAPVGEESLHDHFRRRLAGCTTQDDREAWFVDALAAWNHSTGRARMIPDALLEKGSVPWKKAIARADTPTSKPEWEKFFRYWDVSRATYYRIVRDYRD